MDIRQFKQLSKEMQKVAQERVLTSQPEPGDYFAFGSEIACLRLYHHFSETPYARKASRFEAFESKPLKKWVFRLQLPRLGRPRALKA